MPKQQGVISLEMLSEEESHTRSKPIFEPNTFYTTSDDYSISEAASQVSENSHTSWKNWASHTTEELTPVEPTVTAGTSQRGEFAPCHKEWWNPCPNRISMETKV